MVCFGVEKYDVKVVLFMVKFNSVIKELDLIYYCFNFKKVFVDVILKEYWLIWDKSM